MARTPRHSATFIQTTTNNPVPVEDGTAPDHIAPPTWHRASRQSSTATNSAPLAAADSITTDEDKSITFSPLSNDSDANGDTLSLASIVSGPANGSVTINADGTLTYTPNVNFSGTDTLTYKISDGKGGTATAAIAIAVTAVNDAPVAAADAVTTAENTALTFNPLTNDSDADGDTLSVAAIAANPAHGTVTVNANGTLTYTPTADFSGTDTLTYQVSDGHGGTSTASIAVTVTAGAPAATTGETYTGSDDHAGAIITGTAGADTVTYTHDMSYYTIAETASGFTVTQTGGGIDTLTDIEYLKFADQTYDLANGAPSTDTDTDTGTDSGTVTEDPADTGGDTVNVPSTLSTLPTTGIIKPDVPEATGTNDIVGFQLSNLNSAQATSGDYVTFGQVFAAGSVLATDSLVATINGVAYAVQMDVKTTNADGSVSYAILTLAAPDLAAGATVDGMLSKGSAATSGDVLTASDVLAQDYDLTLNLTMNGTTTTIDAAKVLQDAIADGTVETWMSGSEASEFRVTTWINEYLQATFDIRLYANGEIKTDVSVANATTFTEGVTTFTYDVAIKENGQTLYSESDVSQARATTWHQEVWSDGEPSLYVTYDPSYFIESGAVQAYDTSIGISADVIAELYAALQSADTSLLGSALVEQYMPMSGGRADIGSLSQWAAVYLLSQDPRAYEVLLANADAAGSIPWHYYDEATGEYVRIDLHPDLWIDYRASDAQAVAGSTDTSSTGWTIELAHQPSLTYLAYLITGDHYYLDELQAQASYGIAADNPEYRDGAEGTVGYTQIRAIAWGLRDVGDALYATPDGDPMKAYYETILDNRLTDFINTYIVNGSMDAAEELEGYFLGDYGTAGAMAPWQQDYLVLSLERLATQGVEGASDLLQWMSNFIAGRFINGDYGFDPLYGPAYNLYLGTNPLYGTWAEAYSASATYVLTELDGYPDWAGGYAAGAKGALASIITATGDPDAIEAYGYVVSQATGMVDDYANDPVFSVAPKLADGTYLTHDHIYVNDSSTAATMNGTAADELLHGGSGNDTISGGGGIDLLYGAAGTDTINGGDGDDYLFGGAGNDVLSGGNGADFLRGDGGNDTMTGGAGADTFSIDIREQASNTITDFQIGTDKILVEHAYGADTAALVAKIIAGATTDASGNLVLHLETGNDVTLVGIQAGQITAASLFVTQ